MTAQPDAFIRTYPTDEQFTPEQVQEWIEQFGPIWRIETDGESFITVYHS